MLSRVWSWPIVACAALLALGEAARATNVVNAGPFTITFYNTGETDGQVTGVSDWTSAQMADVAACAKVWSNSIANVPGRQIKVHMAWYEFGNNGILGGASSPSGGDATLVQETQTDATVITVPEAPLLIVLSMCCLFLMHRSR